MFPKPKKEQNQITINNNQSINNNPSQVISNSITPIEGNEEQNKYSTRILFVDDEHTQYKMVSILKKSGWKNTKAVKDITNLDDPLIKDSDIIFVDINGVGKTLFDDQGLGLASALKNKYQDKTIIIYSGETTGNRFHKALREVDGCLSKNAEPYQFIDLIEKNS